MRALYNDNDPKACAWLRELIRAGLIAEGMVDERSILEITPADLEGVRRYHAFAGIGGWDLALRLAGWPEDREVWTASCPCQPFSDAGARRGVRDERNLWPAVFSLVAERRPATVFGEQVASRAGREWLARVRADLEGIGYAFGAADLCAASCGAPHIRQRLFWVADSNSERRPQRQERNGGTLEPGRNAPRGDDALGCGDPRGLGHAVGNGSQGLIGAGAAGGPAIRACTPRRMADAKPVRARSGEPREQGHAGLGRDRPSERGDVGGAWSEFVIVPCGDRKARRIEPSISPLAHGVPARVGRLRGYGNAIVPFVAAVFVKAFVESQSST